MIDHVLKAPINLYFDTTPVGRIINRFTKDLQMVEMFFCYQVGQLYVSGYLTMSIIILSIVVVPWIAFLYPFIFGFIFYLFRLSVAANKEVNRVESLTKSPLLSFMNESVAGNSTIRAFKRKEEFITQNYKFLNNNVNAAMWSCAVPLWFSIRVDVISLITMSVISTICITARFRVDPILLSLLLTYTLSLQQVMSSFLNTLMDVQGRMVSV
jgi:ATP-binding cassette subfamily C (CFTR/MRP) protein 1